MKQSITVLDASNQPTGPFSLQDVRQKLAAGEFKPGQLAHVEGLGAWTPLSEVLAFVEKQNPPAPTPAPIVTTPAPATFQPAPVQTPAEQTTVTQAPSQPSFATPQPQPSFAAPQPSFAAPQPNYSVVNPASQSAVPMGYRPAEFWKRLVAYLVDSLIIGVVISIPVLVVAFVFMTPNQNTGEPNPLYFLGYLLIIAMIAFSLTLYFGFLEGISAHASFGKQIFGLKVVDAQGNGITLGQSFLRSFVKAVLICIPCCIGSIISIITIVSSADAKALHDYIVGTSVIEPNKV